MSEIIEGTAVEEHGTDLAPAAPSNLFRTDNPADVLARAQDTAEALMPVVRKQGLIANIQGKDHLTVEAWQTLGAMLGVTAVCEWTRKLDNGWEARVEARTLDGRVIGAAEAECLRDEKRWADADDYAVRSMAQCVPLRARILTRTGFKGYQQVAIGEEVLAYDQATGRNEWVPLEAVNTFGAEPVVRLRNRSFDFTCTPDHSWACEGGTGARKLVKASALGTYSIVRAAPTPGGDHPMEAREAEVIGWLLTDGTIRYPSRGGVRCHVDQSKPEHIARLRELLDGWATESVNRDAGEHTFPSGLTYATRQAHRFSLTSAVSRYLLALAGIKGKDEVPECLGHLSVNARRAMLRGMLAADGAARPSDGGFEGCRWRFSKQNEATMETVRVLATLEGIALGTVSGFANVNGGWQPTQTLRANRMTSARSLRAEHLAPEPVWCPTTKHGTWVMELDGNVSITGNTRATSKALASVLRFVATLAGFQGTPAEEMPRDGGSAAQSDTPRKPSDKQLGFLERLLKEAGVDGGTVITTRDYAREHLTGGKGGSMSKTIDGLKGDNAAEMLERLTDAAQKWAGAQTDIPLDDTPWPDDVEASGGEEPPF